MQLKTILNRVEPFQSFVYGKAHWVEGGGATGARSAVAGTPEWTGDLLGLRSSGTRL